MSVVVRSFPSFVRPIIGAVLRIPVTYLFGQFSKHTLPIINQHLADLDRATVEPSYEFTPPNTFLTWFVEEARKSSMAKVLMKPENLSFLLMGANFASVHTSTTECTSALLHMIYSDSEYRVIESLREEIDRVMQGANGTWSEATLAKMYRLDSVLHETLRLESAEALTCQRLVMRDTVTDEGLLLKRGTKIAVSSYTIHRDHENYPDAEVFDPFRFSRTTDEEIRVQMQNDLDSNQNARPLPPGTSSSCVSTSEAYLPFAHGRYVSYSFMWWRGQYRSKL